MSDVFRLELLPAREGDCLVLTYGPEARPRRVMIDGGRKATYRDIRARLAALPAAERTFELLVISHVDRDHIEGVLEMLDDPACPVTFRDVWFNGYHHLSDGSVEALGATQGERLSEILRAPGARWNRRLRGRAIHVGRVRRPVRVAGGLTLTLLGPRPEDLAALIPDWDTECRQAGMVRGVAGWQPPPPPPGFEAMGPPDVEALAATPFEPDPSHPNATSIAILAEFRGRRVLLAADAGADGLEASLAPLAAAAGGRLAIDAFKLPHHGSRYNLSSTLLDLLSCSRYLVSSNGSYFDHPHREAIARILRRGPGAEIVFNYRSPESLAWDDPGLRARWGYATTYPAPSDDGAIRVDLDP